MAPSASTSAHPPAQGLLVTSLPTRRPLLPRDQVEPAILLLLEDSGCRLPCLWGITPGETSWVEASNILAQFDPSIDVWEAGSGAEIAHVQIPVSKELASLGLIDITLLLREGLVDSLFVDNLAWQGYNLSGLLEAYGMPGEVWLSTYNRPNTGILPFKLALLYPEHGVAAVYLDLVRMTAGTIWGCFRGNPPVGLRLWSPRGEQTLTEVVDRLAWGWSIAGEPFRPVSEVTRFDLEKFYETFRDPQSDPCIETAAKSWPFR